MTFPEVSERDEPPLVRIAGKLRYRVDGVIYIPKAEYNALHSDYRCLIDGQHYALGSESGGTVLFRVELV